MTQPIYNELSREQKLLAEIAVQLGNISEAINNFTVGDLTLMDQKITELENRIALINAQSSQLQQQVTQPTPDSVSDVISTLGIQLPQ
jgi:hypothetical protein|tara:strand:- start:264 stop:527 length:264 start_codon:yes stop_codon:yes gene_type:complete